MLLLRHISGMRTCYRIGFVLLVLCGLYSAYSQASLAFHSGKTAIDVTILVFAFLLSASLMTFAEMWVLHHFLKFMKEVPRVMIGTKNSANTKTRFFTGNRVYPITWIGFFIVLVEMIFFVAFQLIMQFFYGPEYSSVFAQSVHVVLLFIIRLAVFLLIYATVFSRSDVFLEMRAAKLAILDFPLIALWVILLFLNFDYFKILTLYFQKIVITEDPILLTTEPIPLWRFFGLLGFFLSVSANLSFHTGMSFWRLSKSSR